MSWSHNTHYHGLELNVIPPNCLQALDVGCGQGALARKAGPTCGKVLAIDSDVINI